MNLIDWMEESLGCMFTVVVGGVALFMAACFVVIGMLTAWVDHINWSVRVAEIEQLRHDVRVADPKIGADVIGQAVKFNRDLAQRKAENRLWWNDPFIADEWMTVQPIDLTRQPER